VSKDVVHLPAVCLISHRVTPLWISRARVLAGSEMGMWALWPKS